MKLRRVLYVCWPVLLFASTGFTSWLYDPALVESMFPFFWDSTRVVASLVSPVFWTFVLLSVAGTVAYYMPKITLGHSPHILMSNLARLIASVRIVVSVALTVRAARRVAAR